VWQKGRDLVIKIYELTGNFPKEELFGITSQLKRASLSIPANIAEGFGRFHFLDKAKFYLNARGSLYELRSHLLIAQELCLVKSEALDSIFKMVSDLSVKLNNLINKTRQLKEER
jgi:four helix bundle protein